MINTDVFVIGAGVSGLTLACELRKSGVEVCVAEKARGSGGRMSSKRIEMDDQAIGFDLGALAITAKTAAFKQYISGLQEEGVVDHWITKQDVPYYVGIPRSSSVTRHLANQLNVNFSTRVHSVVREGEHWKVFVENHEGPTLFALAKNVVYACPAEQTFHLLPEKHELKQAIEPVRINCQWTMMLALPHRLEVSNLASNVTDNIQTISYENSKPGRQYPSGLHVYCVQASTEFSKGRIDVQPEVIKAALISDLEAHFDTTLNPVISFIHRWLYAQGSEHGHIDAGFLACEDGVSICGDYLLGDMNVDGIEAAYLSGLALISHLKNANTLSLKVG